MPLKIIDKREFKAQYGDTKGIIENDDALVPNGSSTATRLHELGHLKLNHRNGRKLIREWAGNELDAEIYSYQMRGKEISYRIAFPCLVGLITDLKVKPNEAFSFTIQALKDRGIPFTHKDRHILWWAARTGYYPSPEREQPGLDKLLNTRGLK